MSRLASYAYSSEVLAMVGPVTELLDRGLTACGEAAIASLALWTLSEIEAGGLKPETADDAFTLLEIYLAEQLPAIQLSDEAQELLLEGEHFHHYGNDWGPDPGQLRGLADKILSRVVA